MNEPRDDKIINMIMDIGESRYCSIRQECDYGMGFNTLNKCSLEGLNNVDMMPPMSTFEAWAEVFLISALRENSHLSSPNLRKNEKSAEKYSSLRDNIPTSLRSSYHPRQSDNAILSYADLSSEAATSAAVKSASRNVQPPSAASWDGTPSTTASAPLDSGLYAHLSLVRASLDRLPSNLGGAEDQIVDLAHLELHKLRSSGTGIGSKYQPTRVEQQSSAASASEASSARDAGEGKKPCTPPASHGAETSKTRVYATSDSSVQCSATVTPELSPRKPCSSSRSALTRWNDSNEKESEESRDPTAKRLSRTKVHPRHIERVVQRLYNLSPEESAIARSQNNCKALQKRIDEWVEDVSGVSEILQDTLPMMSSFMKDALGNYLAQKLIELCTLEQFSLLMKGIRKDIVQIAVDMHGTRAIQKAIEKISQQLASGEKESHPTSANYMIVKNALCGHIRKLAIDPNANHVIQKCLLEWDKEACQFICQELISDCISISMERHGCCVMQRCLDVACSLQKELLTFKLCQHIQELSNDPYGNYVIQYLIDTSDEQVNLSIACDVANNLVSFSKQKFSSNVIEKCLQSHYQQVSLYIINEFKIMNPPDLMATLFDSFGNYVLQRALSVAPQKDQDAIILSIKENLKDANLTLVAKRIIKKISKKYPNIFCNDIVDSQDTTEGAYKNRESTKIPKKNSAPRQIQPKRNYHKNGYNCKKGSDGTNADSDKYKNGSKNEIMQEDKPQLYNDNVQLNYNINQISHRNIAWNSNSIVSLFKTGQDEV